MRPSREVTMVKWALYALVISFLVTGHVSSDQSSIPIKSAAFKDPNTGYLYQIRSFNISSSLNEPKQRSIIKVTRLKLGENGIAIGGPEKIQTLKFHAPLVDFDLHCLPTHCYLVAVTSRPRRNIELYSWQRTQFDSLVIKDSFSKPNAVRIFRIGTGFYITIAQEQLHLAPSRLLQDAEESRFVGSVILKFFKGKEQDIRYHQFIKQPFDPLHVDYFKSYLNHGNKMLKDQPAVENHFLVFSQTPEWNRTSPQAHRSYIWSPLNDYFWPYRMPRGVTIEQNPQLYPNHILNFPSIQYPPINQTRFPLDPIEPVESCYHQLQRILIDREIQARRLIDSSATLWRSPLIDEQNIGQTNITAPVIVHGNVVVRGSLIESPQVTIFGHGPPRDSDVHISHMVDSHSPALIENKLKRAFYKLRYIRDKLSRAIPLSILPSNVTQMHSRVRFFGPIKANHFIINNNGIVNSNVRINGIPFKQLEHELVSLRGPQDIGARVIFNGNVVADSLEIHGLVNGAYFIKDALDITSRYVQVINQAPRNPASPFRPTPLEFYSVGASEVILSHNATINDIRLDEFITREGPAQIISGRKIFERVSISHLDLADIHVPLNGLNISRLIDNSIKLYGQSAMINPKILFGNFNTFSRPVIVDELIVNGLINRHINVSMLIHESVKIIDDQPQQISGNKRFLRGLKIGHLTTEGAINGIIINQVLNTNPVPPTADYNRYTNASMNVSTPIPITGRMVFLAPVTIAGDLNSNLVNNLDLRRLAVRRFPNSSENTSRPIDPQIVRGRKIFTRPLRVTGTVRLMNNNEISNISGKRYVYPTVNGLDIRHINIGIDQHMRNPKVIHIDNLEIDGNLDLDNSWRPNGTRMASFANESSCPLNAIREKLILGGGETQFVTGPIRINSLRARSIMVDPNGLNGISFPQNFVLKSIPNHNNAYISELVNGQKSFDRLVVAQPFPNPIPSNPSFANGPKRNPHEPLIAVGPGFVMNSVPNREIQRFVAQERLKNSSGEVVLNTLDVYGNIIAKTINGNNWPDGILLKSIISGPGPTPSPYLHRRIYSPIIFNNPYGLTIDNQLVLRGPIQLMGRLNGVNLTEFARNSVTYGDKDLLSVARTIRNKNFAGGITVLGETRSQGLLGGINFDEMKKRVVHIGHPNSPPNKFLITSPKVFMSDVDFLSPISLTYLNNLALYHFLKRAQNQQEGDLIHITGKKIITGELRVIKSLIVEGPINGINFKDLQARAISLSPNEKEIQFNRTLTIDGNVFMDNLLVDEKNGVIDGVKLSSLVPISINYEKPEPPKYHIVQPPVPVVLPDNRLDQQLDSLRKQIVSMNLVRYSTPNDLIIGFIESPSNDIGSLKLADIDIHEPVHAISMRSFMQLHQVDFPFKLTTYHLSVGVQNNYQLGKNITAVFSSIGGSNLHQLSVLPVEAPRAAMFMKIFPQKALFLLISEDLPHVANRNSKQQCPRYSGLQQPEILSMSYTDRANSVHPTGGVHVYLFHALQNSSSLTSTYFDLYQIIDLPAIDGFEKFSYHGSHYVLATSSSTNRIYLLILRGYTGFELVSHFDVPSLESVKMYSYDERPFILVQQRDGLHKLMEAVII